MKRVQPCLPSTHLCWILFVGTISGKKINHLCPTFLVAPEDPLASREDMNHQLTFRAPVPQALVNDTIGRARHAGYHCEWQAAERMPTTTQGFREGESTRTTSRRCETSHRRKCVTGMKTHTLGNGWLVGKEAAAAENADGTLELTLQPDGRHKLRHPLSFTCRVETALPMAGGKWLLRRGCRPTPLPRDCAWCRR